MSMPSSVAAASTQAVCDSVGSQSLPQGSDDSTTLSRLSQYVESNQQTSAGTSHEALYRYFSSPDYPTLKFEHQSAEAAVAVHEARARAAIDAVHAAMEKQEGWT